MEMLTLYQWLCLIGVPALIATLFRSMVIQAKKINALKLGVQALLRAQMISDFNKWNEAGFAPIYAKDNFENCWQQYHSLGANGVMDEIHKQFMSLPLPPI